MGKDTTGSKELEMKLRGVMDFYVSTYFEHYAKRLKEELSKNNFFIENDIMEARLQSHIDSLKEEATDKFHTAAVVVLDNIMAGREHRVRKFEVLFVDLLKRTLVSDMQENKSRRPIVIVTEKTKEN